MGSDRAERRGLRGRRIAPLLVLLAVALPLAGCGKKQEKNIRLTVEAFYGAVAAKQPDKACPRLAPEARAALERGGKSCEDVLVERTGVTTRASAGTIAIREKTATASVTAGTQQGVVRLRKVGDAWRIVKGYRLTGAEAPAQ